MVFLAVFELCTDRYDLDRPVVSDCLRGRCAGRIGHWRGWRKSKRPGNGVSGVIDRGPCGMEPDARGVPAEEPNASAAGFDSGSLHGTARPGKAAASLDAWNGGVAGFELPKIVPNAGGTKRRASDPGALLLWLISASLAVTQEDAACGPRQTRPCWPQE